MYIEIGNPKPLSSLMLSLPDRDYLKRVTKIAVIDDHPFRKIDALRNHGFNITELGDINSVNQVSEYPIVVCDIRGVGRSLGSDLEGAHLIAEIRKAYPDKFLVTYSGAEFDITYNDPLSSVDTSIAKDALTENWVNVLELGLRKVGDPKERWLRLRRNLLDKDVELHDLLKLEQGFIRAVNRRNVSYLRINSLPPEALPIVRAFAKVALVQILDLLSHD